MGGRALPPRIPHTRFAGSPKAAARPVPRFLRFGVEELQFEELQPESEIQVRKNKENTTAGQPRR
eukprot:8820453-Alexandrium_andersonii.AAC.1